MRTYTQLTREQRYQLSALLKMGHSQTEIAEVIGMHKSTISREIRRNRGQRGYRPKQAHYMAKERRNKPGLMIFLSAISLACIKALARIKITNKKDKMNDTIISSPRVNIFLEQAYNCL